MAFAIYPFIIGTTWEKSQPVLMNHERIHLVQEKELFLIPFLILFYLHSTWILIRTLAPSKAYRLNMFELEAFAHDAELDYLQQRTKFRAFKPDQAMQNLRAEIMARPVEWRERLGALFLIVGIGGFLGVLTILAFL